VHRLSLLPYSAPLLALTCMATIAFLVSSGSVFFFFSFPITPALQGAVLADTCGGLVGLLLLKRDIFYIFHGELPSLQCFRLAQQFGIYIPSWDRIHDLSWVCCLLVPGNLKFRAGVIFIAIERATQRREMNPREVVPMNHC